MAFPWLLPEYVTLNINRLNLAIDIGNTRVKAGVFSGNEIVKTFSFDHWSLDIVVELKSALDIDRIIAGSVRSLNKKEKIWFKHAPDVILLDHLTPLPVRIGYHTPETIGADRVAVIVGAWNMFKHESSLVIDAGTCITYDLIQSDGTYLGGNISPGLRMRLMAMHKFTQKLPQTDLSEWLIDMGTDTKTALQAGAQTGAMYEIRGFIQSYRELFEKLNILLTGGDSHFFVNKLKTKIFVTPELALQGLNGILEFNLTR